MERHWPAADIAPLVALIDPRQCWRRMAPTSCRTRRRVRSSICAQRLTALGREEIGWTNWSKLGLEIADYLEILRSRARIAARIIHDDGVAVRDESATPRKTEGSSTAVPISRTRT